jgi:cell wall-associated NlpC family hydrolase
MGAPDVARYIGLPFGHGPGEATCWSLVVRVYAEVLGIVLPGYGDVSAHDLVRVAREITRGAAGETWAEVADPAPLDVVLMRSARGGRAICHVGLWLAPDAILHADEGAGSAVVPPAHFTIRHRVAGYRRYLR